MDNEERQRTMDFIVVQQAKITTQIENSETRIARLERILKLEIRAGLRERRDFRERYAALFDSQIKTEDAVRELTATTQRNSEDINDMRELKSIVRNLAVTTQRNSEATARNSEDISALAEIVKRTTVKRSGEESNT